MDYKTISFTANEQILKKISGINEYASEIVSYIKADFDLGENWSGFDSVRAIWTTDRECIATVLNDQGSCFVPYEVLRYKGNVTVNLVGSISENNVLTDRLTTFPIVALKVTANAKADGDNTAPITPSQFEQFVEAVSEDADRAEASANDAEQSASESASSASASASSATASAQSATASANSATASEQSATQASGYAQEANISAERAENAKDDAETARDEIRSMRASANTLPAGSDATASYSDGLLTLGIPRGDKGAKGDKGDTGDVGATPNLTIGTVETLDPNESATVTITGTDEDPVLNFGIPKGERGDDGEVTMAQLESLLPTDNASGAIASFPDGTDVFSALSVLTDINPIQDLHGYDKPWSGGNGTNKWDEVWEVGAIDATTGQPFDFASAIRSKNFCEILPSTEYHIHFGSATNQYWLRLFYYDADKNYIDSAWCSNLNVTTPSNAKYFKVLTNNSTDYGTTYKNDIAINYPSSVTTYSPYSNICPISGHTECVTSRVGKNLMDFTPTTMSGIVGSKVNGVIHIQGTATAYSYPINGNPISLEAGTYVISIAEALPSGVTINYTKNSSWGGNITVDGTTITLTQKATIGFYIGVASGTTVNADIRVQLEKGSAKTSFEPYNGTTYTTDLGRTVYGGTLDVVSGVLTVTYGIVNLSTLTWSVRPTYYVSNDIVDSAKKPIDNNTKANAYAEKYNVTYRNGMNNDGDISINADGQIFCRITETPTGQLVYELATPQTYQLTPTEVALLLGTNNVWTDCGEISVVYKADIQKWVEKKLSA